MIRKILVIVGLVGVLFAAGCTAQKTTAKPAKTSTPPAASTPSEPVPTEAPSSSADPSAFAPEKLNVGQTTNITTTDENDFIQRADVTVNQVRDLGSVIRDPDGYRELDEHASKGRFIVVTVTYVVTTNAFDYNEFDWAVVMPDGQRYDAGAVMSDVSKYGQALNSGTLREGQRVKGTVTFDVPKTHGLLTYNASLENDVAEWKI